MNISKIRIVFIILSIAISVGYSADVHAPKPFKAIMADATGKNWTPSSFSSIENRAHVVFIDNTGSYCLQVGDDISGALAVGDLAPLKDGTATYSDALRSMFQVLDLNTASLATDDLASTYTVHPELASYYAVDSEEGVLTVRDKSSIYHTDQNTSAYIAFSINDASGSAVAYTLQASSRYVYNTTSGSYTIDNGWSGDQWVVLNPDMTVTLTTNAADATNWTIANSRDLIDVVADPGSDFNPQATSWQTNTFAAYPTDANTGAAGGDGILEADDVARLTLDCAKNGKFLALPHKEVATYIIRKSQDTTRWIKGASRSLARFAQDARNEVRQPSKL